MDNRKYFGWFYLISLVLFTNCKNPDASSNPPIAKDMTTEVAVSESPQPKEILPVYPEKFITLDNVMVNHHKLMMTKEEFDKIYPKLDSTKTELWECGSPFEWLDKEWMTKTYGPKNEESGIFENFDGKITTLNYKNTAFITNKHLVIFNEGTTDNNTFSIISPKITLNKNTTVEQFKKMFPNVEMRSGEQPDEVNFFINTDRNMDDAFIFYFKNGKLHTVELWWLLC